MRPWPAVLSQGPLPARSPAVGGPATNAPSETALFVQPPKWPNRLIPRAGLDRGHPGVTEPAAKGRLRVLAPCTGAGVLLARSGENGNPKRILKASINAGRERESPFPFLRTTPFPSRLSGDSVKSCRVASSWLGGHNTC